MSVLVTLTKRCRKGYGRRGNIVKTAVQRRGKVEVDKGEKISNRRSIVEVGDQRREDPSPHTKLSRHNNYFKK